MFESLLSLHHTSLHKKGEIFHFFQIPLILKLYMLKKFLGWLSIIIIINI